jgi:hypothetical protein
MIMNIDIDWVSMLMDEPPTALWVVEPVKPLAAHSP